MGAINWKQSVFPNGGRPWGRQMEGAVQDHESRLTKVELAIKNAIGTAVSSISAGLSQSQVLTMIADALSAFVYSGSIAGTSGNIDQSRVVNTWTKDVSTAGAVSASGVVTGAGGINSIDAYSRSLTTSFRSVSVTSTTGFFGFATSSKRFKQDVETFVPNNRQVAALLRLVQYRSIADVEEFGERAGYQIGLIAEELVALGLEWLVEYEDDKVFGINYDRAWLVLIPWVQAAEERFTAIEVRLSKLEHPNE